jgi:acetylornithine deacetylase
LWCAGFKALCDAFTAVTGDCKPYSITGSLPCIRDLQEAGFDVQTLGFGKLAAYHSNNGECLAGVNAEAPRCSWTWECQ